MELNKQADNQTNKQKEFIYKSSEIDNICKTVLEKL